MPRGESFIPEEVVRSSQKESALRSEDTETLETRREKEQATTESELNCSRPPEVLRGVYELFCRNKKAYFAGLFAVNAMNAAAIGYTHRDEMRKFIDLQKPVEQRIEEGEQRLDDLHLSAARELREHIEPTEKYSLDEIDAIALALEDFSSKKFFEGISEESGMPVEELIQLHNTNDIFVYTDETIDAYLERDFGSMVLSVLPESRSEAAKEWALSGHSAGLNNERGAIFLNMTSLVEAADGDTMLLRSMTTDVILHEQMHSFSGEKLPSRGEYDSENMFYEGTTELLSNVVRSRVDGKRDIYAGYNGGQTAAAAVVYEGLPDGSKEFFWKSYITGDPSGMASLIDDSYGAGSYQRLLGGRELVLDQQKVNTGTSGLDTLSVNEEQTYHSYYSLTLLDNALEIVAPSDEKIGVADEANDWLGGGKIVPIRGKTFHGVSVVYPDGAQNGFIRFQGERGPKIVSLVQDTANGDSFRPMYNTNMGVLWTDLERYNKMKEPIYDLSFEDRGYAMVKMIKAHKEDFETLKKL